jgi:hypothetical protein
MKMERCKSLYLWLLSKQVGVAIFAVARDFIAKHLSKSACNALKHFETVVQNLHAEK